MSIDLSSLGWDDAFAAAFAEQARRGCRPARVSRVDRGVCTALSAAGPVRATVSGSLLAAAARDPRMLPCAGDWVAVRTWPDDRLTMEAVLPRRSAIVRHAAGKESLGQVLAANVDAVAVVEPVDPAPDPGRIERLLTLAFESGARPLVILTKADLAADPAALAAQVPGDVEVHAVSARTGAGIDRLLPLVAPGRTLGLLGPSGAGKSSLVNALAGTPIMETQTLRADGRGRHTTTYRALIPLPGAGAILDTPGVRLVGMLDAAGGLDRAFDDVTALAVFCKYRDCTHGEEPDCAVRDALESGELSARRLASWRKLNREETFASVRASRRRRPQRRLARP